MRVNMRVIRLHGRRHSTPMKEHDMPFARHELLNLYGHVPATPIQQDDTARIPARGMWERLFQKFAAILRAVGTVALSL